MAVPAENFAYYFPFSMKDFREFGRRLTSETSDSPSMEYEPLVFERYKKYQISSLQKQYHIEQTPNHIISLASRASN